MHLQKYNKLMVGFAVVLLFCLATTFGYWLAGGFQTISDDWIHPSARGAAWWEILTALGVPAAVIIALFSDWRTHQRFEDQQHQQSKQIDSIKQNQIDEWKERERQQERAKSELTVTVRAALQKELEVTLKRLHGLQDALFTDTENIQKRRTMVKCSFPRPFADRLATIYEKIDADLAMQCALREAEFRSVQSMLDMFIEAERPRNVEAMKHEVELLITTGCRYLVFIAPHEYAETEIKEFMRKVVASKA